MNSYFFITFLYILEDQLKKKIFFKNRESFFVLFNLLIKNESKLINNINIKYYNQADLKINESYLLNEKI